MLMLMDLLFGWGRRMYDLSKIIVKNLPLFWHVPSILESINGFSGKHWRASGRTVLPAGKVILKYSLGTRRFQSKIIRVEGIKGIEFSLDCSGSRG